VERHCNEVDSGKEEEMKWIVVLLTLALASCSTTDAEKAQQIQAKVNYICGVLPSLSSIAAVLAAATHPATGPVVSGVSDISKAICAQYKSRQGVQTFASDYCIATVNGVCVEEEKGQDVPKED
jgi:hypothetical protein